MMEWESATSGQIALTTTTRKTGNAAEQGRYGVLPCARFLGEVAYAAGVVLARTHGGDVGRPARRLRHHRRARPGGLSRAGRGAAAPARTAGGAALAGTAPG